jgi:hypothetical protein
MSDPFREASEESVSGDPGRLGLVEEVVRRFLGPKVWKMQAGKISGPGVSF